MVVSHIDFQPYHPLAIDYSMVYSTFSYFLGFSFNTTSPFYLIIAIFISRHECYKCVAEIYHCFHLLSFNFPAFDYIIKIFHSVLHFISPVEFCDFMTVKY